MPDRVILAIERARVNLEWLWDNRMISDEAMAAEWSGLDIAVFAVRQTYGLIS